MNKFTRIAVVVAVTLVAGSQARAQGPFTTPGGAFSRPGYVGGYQQGGMLGAQNLNWNVQQNGDWGMQQGMAYQNPRAAAVGGILQGIGAALSNNPRSQQAGAILGGIGGGIQSAVPYHQYQNGYQNFHSQGAMNQNRLLQFQSSQFQSQPQSMNPYEQFGMYGYPGKRNGRR